jgi:hypothetical protein
VLLINAMTLLHYLAMHIPPVKQQMSQLLSKVRTMCAAQGTLRLLALPFAALARQGHIELMLEMVLVHSVPQVNM